MEYLDWKFYFPFGIDDSFNLLVNILEAMILLRYYDSIISKLLLAIVMAGIYTEMKKLIQRRVRGEI